MAEMSIGEAMDVITRFQNVFAATERIKQALQMAANAEGEIARLNAMKKEAEEAAKVAIEARDKAKALLEQTEGRLRSFQEAFDLEVSERRKLADEQIEKLKAELREKAAELKANHQREVSKYIDGLKDRVQL